MFKKSLFILLISSFVLTITAAVPAQMAPEKETPEIKETFQLPALENPDSWSIVVGPDIQT